MTLRNPRSSFLAASLFSTLLVLSTVACSSSDPEDSGSDDDSSDGGGSDGDVDGSGGGSGGDQSQGGADGTGGTGGTGGDGGSGDGGTGGGGNSGDDDLDDDGVLDEVDVDVDGDGLVEVRTLAELDGIRFSLGGNGRATEDDIDTTGCPTVQQGACHGYELTLDLDFDTNGNGSSDPGDTYHDPDHDGSNQGWLPITDFFADFEGNGHVIDHFYVNRPSDTLVGLFGSIQTTTGRSSGVQNVKFTRAHVRGGFHAGVLAGRLLNRNPSATLWVLVDGVVAQGSVISTVLGEGTGTGGLVGAIFTEAYLGTPGARIRLENSRFEGEVEGREYVGGLVGRINATGGGSVVVTESYASASVKSTSTLTSQAAGGLVGNAGTTDASLNSVFEVTRSFALGAVDSHEGCAGGLIGRFSLVNGTGELADSFSAMSVSGDAKVGGLVGCGSASGTSNGQIQRNFVVGEVTGGEYVAGALFAGLTNGVGASWNHYATDTVGLSQFIPGVDDPDASMAVTASDLECPDAPDNVDDCVEDVTLYDDWSTDIWSFDAGRLPGLVLEAGTYWVEQGSNGWTLVQQL